MNRIVLALAFLLAIMPFHGVLRTSAAASMTFEISGKQSAVVKEGTAELVLTGYGLSDIYSFEAALSYDPQKVEFLQALSSLDGFSISRIGDDGKLVFAFTRVGDVQGLSGNTVLSVFSFKSRAAGQTDIRLDSVKAFNSALSQSTAYTGNTVSLTLLDMDTSEATPPAAPENTGNGISHELGTITASGDVTLLTVSPAKLDSLASAALDSIVIDIGSMGRTSGKAVDIPARAWSGLREAGKDIVIQSGGLKLRLPYGSLQPDEITDRIRITITNDGRWANDASGAGLTAVSGAFGISIKAGEQELKLLKQAEITLTLDKTTDMRKTGVYAYKDASLQWVYAGGKTGKNQISFNTLEATNAIYGAFLYNKKFADLTDRHWAWDYVEVLAARHVVDGVNETDFSPESKVTRAEFAAMAARLLKLPAAVPGGSYPDVENGAWYGNVIAAAVQAGILEGYGEGVIRPLDMITRQEMIMMAVRILEKSGQGQSSGQAAGAAFADNDAIAPWARQAAAYARQAGLTDGKPGNLFAPLDNATRAEAAAVLYRLLNKTEGL